MNGQDLLIGIGNPLRGDDGVGALLLEELARELGAWSTASAELKAVHQLTPELALLVGESRRVLFLDACVSPRTTEPWIERLAHQSVQPEALGGHCFSPQAVVALARGLYGWAGEGALLRVPAFSFPQGTALSEPLVRRLPKARQLMRQWLAGG